MMCASAAWNSLTRGRRFELLGAHLRAHGAEGIFLKIDVEGYEWEALAAATDDELRKVSLFDLQLYLCNDRTDRKSLRSRVNVLERLAGIFGVVARAPADVERFRGQDDDAICAMDGRYPGTVSVSYVNRADLAAIAIPQST